MKSNSYSGRPAGQSTGPGRPREFDEDEALSAIMNAFWKEGYEGTGLSDLVAATGVRKASLYSAFGNKHEMYLRSLRRYDTLVVGSACRALSNRERPADERLAAFLGAPIAALSGGKGRQGCFLCNASADRADLDPDTAKLVAEGYRRMIVALEVAVSDLPPDTHRPAGGAELAMSVYSGLRIMARAGLPVAVLETAQSACLAALRAT